MKNVDAAEWRNALQVNGKEDAYIFALSVDTTYPVQDSFYTESQTYAQYGGTAVWVFAAGVAAAILFALGLIWLTLAAGRRPEDEELHLNSFDHWKTEIAALLVVGIWLAGVTLVLDGRSFERGECRPESLQWLARARAPRRKA